MYVARVSRTARNVYVSSGVNTRAVRSARDVYTAQLDEIQNTIDNKTDATGKNSNDKKIVNKLE